MPGFFGNRVTHAVRNIQRVGVSLLLLTLGAGCSGETAPTPEAVASAPAPSPPSVSGDAVELEFWQSVKDSQDADQLLAYIKRYPQGDFIELAETRLKNLTTTNQQADPNVAGPGASNVDPPRVERETRTAAAPPPPTAKPKRPSRRDRVLSVVNRSLKGYRDPRLHIYPNIPRFKADNAASIHGMDPRSILVLYDDGLGGGGKTGFTITDSRVHWRFVKGADPYFLEFRDIQSAIARKNKFLLNGHDVGTTMSSSSRYAAQVYADLMLSLRDSAR